MANPKNAIALQSHLSPSDCQARLSNAVDPVRLGFTRSGFSGDKPILGTFANSYFRLQARRYYRNSFAPFFYGRFLPDERGTLIQGQFRLHPCARLFMIFWFGFIAFFIIFAVRAPGRFDAARVVFFVLGPLTMAAFGYGLLKFSWWLARDEKKDIIAVLKKTLQATETTPRLPPTQN
jgi:hypothetical protein